MNCENTAFVNLTRPDCEIMVYSMIERTAGLEAHIKQHQSESLPGDRT